MTGHKQECSNCRFWLRYVGRDEGGCWRFPPTVLHAPEMDLSGHPLQTVVPDSLASAWCGEWQAANPRTVDDAAAVMARAVLAGDAGAARLLADKLIELIPLPVYTSHE